MNSLDRWVFPLDKKTSDIIRITVCNCLLLRPLDDLHAAVEPTLPVPRNVFLLVPRYSTAAGERCLAIFYPTLLLRQQVGKKENTSIIHSLELSLRIATKMEDPLKFLEELPSQKLVPLGAAMGPVASWEVYDLSLLPKNRAAINSRVLKYTSLTKNLTMMMASVYRLYRDPKYQTSFGLEVVNLASRLTWIMLYFYGAMTHYSSWIFGQTQVNSVAQIGGPSWITFLQSLHDFFAVLANLPNNWLNPGTEIIIDDIGQQQIIPAEAPLELVSQIYLIVHDEVNHLRDPGKTMLSWSFSKFKAGARPELI